VISSNSIITIIDNLSVGCPDNFCPMTSSSTSTSAGLSAAQSYHATSTFKPKLHYTDLLWLCCTTSCTTIEVECGL